MSESEYQLSWKTALARIARLDTPQAHMLGAIVSGALLGLEQWKRGGNLILAHIYRTLQDSGEPPDLSREVPDEREIPMAFALQDTMDQLAAMPNAAGGPPELCAVILKWAGILYFSRDYKRLEEIALAIQEAVLPAALATIAKTCSGRNAAN